MFFSIKQPGNQGCRKAGGLWTVEKEAGPVPGENKDLAPVPYLWYVLRDLCKTPVSREPTVRRGLLASLHFMVASDLGGLVCSRGLLLPRV